jgi:hypothetical protein
MGKLSSDQISPAVSWKAVKLTFGKRVETFRSEW